MMECQKIKSKYNLQLFICANNCMPEIGMVRFGLVWFFKEFWTTPNRTISSVQNGQVLVHKWSEDSEL